jgi:hypothetical protein
VGGGFLQTAWVARQSNQTVDFNFKINSLTTGAPPANGIAGNHFIAQNTGANTVTGHRIDYISTATGAGHDTALSIVTRSETAIRPQLTTFEALWIECESPIDTTTNFSGWIGELNYVNRGVDAGFKRDRSLPGNNSGGLLFVPEKNVASGTGGEGKNVGFAFSVAHSGEANSTGFPVKTYIAFNVEPNASVGQTGRAFYASGDITGVASQYPYGPFQTEGTWLHGVDTTLATFTDARAMTMLAGQGLAWITGTTGTPTGAASIAGSGSGADLSITLTPAGTGVVTVNKIASGALVNAANDAAAAGAGVAVNQFYRNGSVVMQRVV